MAVRTLSSVWLVCLCMTGGIIGAMGDTDLMSFVSNPLLRPPIFNVTQHDYSRTTPGYWFVAPYADLLQRDPGKLLVPGQVGPHIYADDGTLIWSGAELFPARGVCDFRQTIYNGSLAMSFVMTASPTSKTYRRGVAIVLDDTYSIVEEVFSPMPDTDINMHEFKVEDDGQTALIIYDTSTQWPWLDEPEHQWGFIDSGIAEIDLPSKKPRFMWNCSDHISLATSTKEVPTQRNAWDWIHLNTLDRDEHGDFLVTARHTNAIYKVSRSTGTLMWQLGGAQSSFELKDFSFSRQHDARFIQSNDTTTIISLLNNASDGIEITGNYSSAQLVKLDHETMTATLIKQWDRPDGELSHLRGNMQILPDSNIFVGWSGTDGYMTEHSADGDVLTEARFVSERLSTYRAYKFFNFQGRPQSPPSLKALAYQAGTSTALTAIYVSWNGATEVKAWNFYVSHNNKTSDFTFAGQTRKTGFETLFTHDGLARYVIAEAITADGTALRNSTVEIPTPQYDGCQSSDNKEKLQCLLNFERRADAARDPFDVVGGGEYDDVPGKFVRLQGILNPTSLSLIVVGFCLSHSRALLRWPSGR